MFPGDKHGPLTCVASPQVKTLALAFNAESQPGRNVSQSGINSAHLHHEVQKETAKAESDCLFPAFEGNAGVEVVSFCYII